MLNFEEFNVMIIQLDSEMSDAEIACIQSNFIFNEVSRTRTTRKIDIELIDDLSNEHLIMQMIS